MKTKKPIRAKRVATKRGSLKLPTLAAFKRLSLRSRTKVFLAWVKTQSGRYVFLSNKGCPLARFGNALMDKNTAVADHCGFWPTEPEAFVESTRIQVILDCLKGETNINPLTPCLDEGDYTYEALATRLTAHLAS